MVYSGGKPESPVKTLLSYLVTTTNVKYYPVMGTNPGRMMGFGGIFMGGIQQHEILNILNTNEISRCV